MDCAAIDLHKKDGQMRIVTEGGAIVGRHDRLTAVFRGPMRMRILDGSVDELAARPTQAHYCGTLP